MAVTEDYLAFVLEQFARVAPVTSRRMFGGVGIYADGVFFGVIDNNQIFLRTGPGNLADYESVGSAAFQPMGPDTKPMSYHELPVGVLEDVAKLRLWVSKAITEATATKKPVKRKRGGDGSPSPTDQTTRLAVRVLARHASVMQLTGKTCVVTGAARGIGLALAEMLVAAGAKAVLSDIDAGALAEALKRFLSGSAAGVAADVSKAADMQRLAEEATRAFGPVDVWINNAGLARHRWIPDYTEAEIDLMLDVNLKGTILGSQAALQRMIPRKAGSIVNIISTASLRGVPSETVYCAAKWGVRGFTQGLQEEAAPHGIRVIAVLPGGVATEFWSSAAERPAPLEKFLTAAQVADAVRRLLEMDDWVTPRELVLRSLADSDFSVKPA